jgi:hypothetical protein
MRKYILPDNNKIHITIPSLNDELLDIQNLDAYHQRNLITSKIKEPILSTSLIN